MSKKFRTQKGTSVKTWIHEYSSVFASRTHKKVKGDLALAMLDHDIIYGDPDSENSIFFETGWSERKLYSRELKIIEISYNDP